MDSFLKQALKGQKYNKVPLIEEGSDRRYTRILLKTKEQGLPPQALKNKEPDQPPQQPQTQFKAHKSWILAHSPLEQQEYFLWRQADFLKAGLNVPKLHPAHKVLSSKESHVAPYQESDQNKKPMSLNSQKGFLLIEDLGDHSLEKEALNPMGFEKGATFKVFPTAKVDKQQENSNKMSITKPKFPYDYYFQALDQLIQLQKSFGFFQTGSVPSPWTKQDFLKEMFYTEKYLVQKFLNYQLKENQREALLKELEEISHKLARFPFCPGHRDFHSRNLFIKNKKIYMIDFQDAGFFPRFYDAVSLIYDVYIDSQIDKQVREKLLTYFISKTFPLKQKENDKGTNLKDSSCPLSVQQAFSNKNHIENQLKEEIALTALQRLFQAVGRFAGFYCLKKQSTHLKHIYPGLKIQEELLRTQLVTKNGKPSYPCFLHLIQDILDLSLEK